MALTGNLLPGVPEHGMEHEDERFPVGKCIFRCPRSILSITFNVYIIRYAYTRRPQNAHGLLILYPCAYACVLCALHTRITPRRFGVTIFWIVTFYCAPRIITHTGAVFVIATSHIKKNNIIRRYCYYYYYYFMCAVVNTEIRVGIIDVCNRF